MILSSVYAKIRLLFIRREQHHVALEFVFLPLFFYLGAAGQAIGLYVFGILFAAFYGLRRSGLSSQMQKSMFGIGSLLLAMHLVFPVVNLIVELSPPSDWPAAAQTFVQNRTVKQYFESQFSSAVALIGVSLMLLGTFNFSSLHKPHLADAFKSRPLLPYSVFSTVCF